MNIFVECYDCILSLEYVYAKIILQNKTKMVFSSPSALKGAWQQVFCSCSLAYNR